MISTVNYPYSKDGTLQGTWFDPKEKYIFNGDGKIVA